VKTCASCGKEKALSAFGKDKQKKDGLRAYCRVCMKAKGTSEGAKKAQTKFTDNNPESVMYSNAKQRAKREGLPFNLKPTDIDIPDVCPALGIPMKRSNVISEGSPTLDKVIPELGYIRGNIVVISNLANRMKSNHTSEQLQLVVNYINGHDGRDPVLLEILLPIKILSANKMHYANAKRDTVEYKRYKLAIFNALKAHRFKVNDTDKYKFSLIAGFSSKLSDLDNAFKPLLDSLQRVLSFDDRQVFEIEALKDHVKKGEEYMMIRMEVITESQWKRRLTKLKKGTL